MLNLLMTLFPSVTGGALCWLDAQKVMTVDGEQDKMAGMTPDELLDVFHRRIRLPDADTIPGWKQELDGLVHRSYFEGEGGGGFVETPRGLGDDPDAVIAGQVEFFRERGLEFEWKTYAYDEPADLGERLIRAGFVAAKPETLILGEVDTILARPSALPSKVRMRDVEDAGRLPPDRGPDGLAVAHGPGADRAAARCRAPDVPGPAGGHADRGRVRRGRTDRR